MDVKCPKYCFALTALSITTIIYYLIFHYGNFDLSTAYNSFMSTYPRYYARWGISPVNHTGGADPGGITFAKNDTGGIATSKNDLGGINARKNATGEVDSSDNPLNPYCKVIQLNPFDSSIIDYITSVDNMTCLDNRSAIFMQIADDGQVFIDQNMTDILFNGSEFGCAYAYYTARTNDFSKEVQFYVSTSKKALDSNISLSTDVDFLKVRCYALDRPTVTIYNNAFAFGTLNDKKTYDQSDPKTPDKISVLVIILESSSSSAVKRHLKNTLHYLTNELKGGHVFSMFNKVGHNSDPNAYALLSGKKINYGQTVPDFTPVDLQTPVTSMDDVPFIWKRFSAQNYSTSYNSDDANLGIFRRIKDGLRRRPTDFYYMQFWKVVLPKSFQNCANGRPSIEIQLETVKRLIFKLNNTLQFNTVFATALTHETPSNLEAVDQYLKPFLETLETEGFLNKTALVILGDHGALRGKIRETLTGAMEERMPFLYVRLRPPFVSTFPQFQKSLTVNADRLVTHFDVHEMLVDLTDVQQAVKNGQRPRTSRGMSLLFPIPANRTCSDAGIADYFCSCQRTVPMDTNNATVISAAQALIGIINDKIKNATKCAKFTMQNVTRSERVVLPETTTGQIFRLRVLVECQEKLALFETELTLVKNSKWEAAGQITRINTYGPYSYCINDRLLMPYCVCK